MLRIPATAGLLRRTRLLLAYNKSSGYRWSPIPKPPPAHYDRLYGVHAVLNTLRVAAAAAQQQQRNALSSAGSSDAPAEAAGKGKESREGTAEAHSSQRTALSSAAASSPHVGGPSSLHPHRGHLSCLYVRDFSLEEEEEDGSNGKRGRSAHKTVSVAGRRRRKEKVIPARYTAVRCIAALAKSLEVPIRFVPRSELVQLCGERRNQNVVLEASTYAPLEVGRLADVWRRSTDGAEDTQVEGGSDSSAPSLKSASASTRRELVLFLDRILDPTNVGGILRTAFFFGVDHVILSRDCAACTRDGVPHQHRILGTPTRASRYGADRRLLAHLADGRR
ncbi:putative mitochondrial hypothetical protein [Leptomonas pyrrhocoris]|uniref:tRNA/rRNA methyltransferase SpoU type domain-containing protein n=1 Tax=Leptomonas pyrrhocoris TaxID=157538 RepID=A0A0M9G6T9_LEPPY|nr:putative mitochondrial hypothetical protein [Leptomonas pyrrhocoris]KPA83643.1 putative mitochondrial hypothetical protein [Leptomonas pyrrhocoris]|eukprot:XP_015662082.1 putative mitochondrial hypothetical protein [Leptomonas pyrrhocoris]